jgi:hypothetical protein
MGHQPHIHHTRQGRQWPATTKENRHLHGAYLPFMALARAAVVTWRPHPVSM